MGNLSFLNFVDFAITGRFDYSFAVECTEKVLKQYYKELPVKLMSMGIFSKPSHPILVFIRNSEIPIVYGILALPLIFFILFLNKKKYVESYGIRMFTNFYLTIHAIRCVLLILEVVYKYIWAYIYTNNVICGLKSDIIYPPSNRDWGDFLYYDYPRTYIYLSSTLDVFDEWTKHIFSLLLILHRTMTYCACSHIFTFNKWFNEKKLRIYYIFLVFFTYSFIHCKTLLYSYFSSHDSSDKTFRTAQIIFEEIIAIIVTLIHILITILSIYSVFSLQNTNDKSKLEIKYFLYFSILPTITSALFVLCQIVLGWDVAGWAFYSRKQRALGLSWFGAFSQIAQGLFILLSDTKPLFDSILLFICVPIYRKIILRIFIQRQKTVVTSIVFLK